MGHVNGCPKLLIKYIMKVFNTTFMGNIKKLSKKLIILSFFHKMFLKIVYKPMHLGHSLTFSYYYFE